jgi:hypothetical protein
VSKVDNFAAIRKPIVQTMLDFNILQRYFYFYLYYVSYIYKYFNVGYGAYRNVSMIFMYHGLKEMGITAP